MTASLILTGLDGTNPLGFLAALGILAVADTKAAGARLSWRRAGRWHPVLTSPLDRTALLACSVDDLQSWANDPAVALSYAKPTKEGAKKKTTEPKLASDLK